MPGGIFCRAILSSRTTPRRQPTGILANIKPQNVHTKREIPTKEIKIPIQYGHIAAKLWGNDQDRPILAIHGWQDNAGTWDTLAPMLCQNRSILAVDLPGHGHSSWIPAGMHYYFWDYIRLIMFVKDYFKWDKVSLLSHSMGSTASLRFASLFPDEVDLFVAIDALIIDDLLVGLSNELDIYSSLLKKLQITQTCLNMEPNSHPMEEIYKIWHFGTKKSVTLESVKYLAHRGTKPSPKDPTKFFFSRDPRLKYSLFQPEDNKTAENLVKRLKCPTLYIKALDSPYATGKFSLELRKIIRKNLKDYENQSVPGTHYVHLNHPERLAPLILQFMKKYNMHI